MLSSLSLFYNMSFISIQRYWGDDHPADAQFSSTSDLLSKIEVRRRKRAAAAVSEFSNSNSNLDEVHDDGIISQQSEPFRKKKKTRKSISSKPESQCHVNDVALEEALPVNNNLDDSYTIPKDLEFRKTSKVKRVLPSWLAKPSIVSVDLRNLDLAVSDIQELDKKLVAKLKQNNVSHFFPVQSQLIPWILKFHKRCKGFWPRDVCVSAPTGSGKTLSFVLPILQLLKGRLANDVGALIVLPTKDLAYQVFRVFKMYSAGTKIRVIHLGNDTLEKEKRKIIAEDEIQGCRSIVDIIVTTPGRLVEHLKYTKGLSFNNLKFLVIDEADHVMDSVQNDWLKHLQARMPPFSLNSEMSYLTLNNIRKRPPRTQKLLFSATLSQDPEKLKLLNLFQPCLFTSVVKSTNTANQIEKREEVTTEFVGKYTTPSELEEFVTVCPLQIKPLVLYHLLKKNEWKKILCFADSVTNAHKLSNLLRLLNSLDENSNQLSIVEISSKLAVEVHREVLDKFNRGLIDIIVTTDNLARGIDLQKVEYVVLYDTPKFIKNYIHRIGRTGRAGNKGTSLTLVTPDQKEDFYEMLASVGKTDFQELKVSLVDLRELESAYKDAVKTLRLKNENDKTHGNINMPNRRKRRSKIRK